jgi:hypothetical protein
VFGSYRASLSTCICFVAAVAACCNLAMALWFIFGAISCVPEPTNYTKLSKKITVEAHNLANLSPYNPVVRETAKDFKPTNIQTKIVQV